MRTGAFAITTVLAARLASADCPPPTGKQTHAKIDDAVFLVEAKDLLGHRAAYFFDTASATVIGPLDLDAWPGGHRKPVASIGAAPGTHGVLELSAWLDDPTRVAKALGYVESFHPVGKPGDLAALVPRLDDPFVLGLLAGAHPVAPYLDAAVALRKDPEGRDRAGRAAVGMLYTADDAHVQQLLAGYAFRDFGGARLDRIATLARGGLAAVAKLPPDLAKIAWTDYLPELANAYAAHKDLRQALDDLLLGHDTPIVPVELGRGLVETCGPSRQELRGPFVVASELTNVTLRDLVRAKDHGFAEKAELAFKDVSAGAAQYVVAIRSGYVLVAGSGSDGFVAITPDHSLQVGSKVRWVARRTAARSIAPPYLDPQQLAITDGGTTTRLDSPATDAPAMIAELKSRARSGNLHAGTALALLFELAGQVDRWTLDDARRYAWSLPGNTYATPAQWQQAWSEILMHAIREAPDTRVADEVERALPTIFAGFLRAPGAPHTQLPADVVRKLAIDVAADIVARRLLAGDAAGAERIVAFADGPIDLVAKPVPVGLEPRRDANYAARIEALQALVTAVRKKPVKLPPAAARSFEIDLLGVMMRPYAPSVRAAWINALVAAGYPRPK